MGFGVWPCWWYLFRMFSAVDFCPLADIDKLIVIFASRRGTSRAVIAAFCLLSRAPNPKFQAVFLASVVGRWVHSFLLAAGSAAHQVRHG